VYPELSITNYTGIPAEEVSFDVPESEVETTLKKLQDDMSELSPVEAERPVNQGDFVEISFTGTAAGEQEPLFTEKATVEVGGPSTLQEFTENLTGMTVNEEKTFSVTYREDYPEKRLAGKTLAYQIKVEAIKEKKVPELNDEFAQGLGQYSTFEEWKGLYWTAERGRLPVVFPNRPLLFAPYALAHLTGRPLEALNLMQAGAMLAKGALVYLLVVRLLPGSGALAFLAGALTIVYPADTGFFTLRTVSLVRSWRMKGA